MLYGRQAANAAAAVASNELETKPSVAPTGPPSLLPDLAPEFFGSAFFRRFQVQSECQYFHTQNETIDVQDRFSNQTIS
jgi:hypothetical protein